MTVIYRMLLCLLYLRPECVDASGKESSSSKKLFGIYINNLRVFLRPPLGVGWITINHRTEKSAMKCERSGKRWRNVATVTRAGEIRDFALSAHWQTGKKIHSSQYSPWLCPNRRCCIYRYYQSKSTADAMTHALFARSLFYLADSQSLFENKHELKV